MAGKKAGPGENWANSQMGQDSGLPSNSGAPNGRVSGGIYDLYRAPDGNFSITVPGFGYGEVVKIKNKSTTSAP